MGVNKTEKTGFFGSFFNTKNTPEKNTKREEFTLFGIKSNISTCENRPKTKQ